MNVKDKVVVVTGGASGIGRALCRRFAADGAKAVVVVDLDEAGAKTVAEEIGKVGEGLRADVGIEADIAAVVEATLSRHGQIDLFCSNAGILFMDGDTAASSSNAQWEKIWAVNVMAHVYAARAVLPDMIRRGDGYFVNTASAAGLLSQIGSATYSVTKHAAVGFAESLAITHGDDGIKVSVLCPQAVRTAMIDGAEDGGVAGGDGVIEAEAVAEAVVQGLADEHFLILPHPEVAMYMERKVSDYDRWLKGMRRLRTRHVGGAS